MVHFTSKNRFYFGHAVGRGATIRGVDTMTFKAGDYKLSATTKDNVIIKDLSFKEVNFPGISDFVLAIEKPDCFILDYNVTKNDLRFQTMCSTKVGNRTLNLTGVNSGKGTWSSLGGSLEINSSTKGFLNHDVVGGNTKFGCQLQNGPLRFEPSYNLKKNALKFDVSYTKPAEDGDVVFRATCKTSSNKLGLEWAHNSKIHKPLNKISASIDMAHMWEMPKVCIECTIWEFDV